MIAAEDLVKRKHPLQLQSVDIKEKNNKTSPKIQKKNIFINIISYHTIVFATCSDTRLSFNNCQN